jgi:hypothetical protein
MKILPHNLDIIKIMLSKDIISIKILSYTHYYVTLNIEVAFVIFNNAIDLPPVVTPNGGIYS